VTRRDALDERRPGERTRGRHHRRDDGDLDGRAGAGDKRPDGGEERSEVDPRADLPLAAQVAGERAPRPEEQRLDCLLAHAELLRDLAVRQALPLAEEDRPPLLLRQPAEAARSSIRSSPSALRAGASSWSTCGSRATSTRPRRRAASQRFRQTFRAIFSGHAISTSGTTPRSRARSAWAKVVWAASSASSGFASRRRQKRRTRG